jgi:outer membrane protein insertion porin family
MRTSVIGLTLAALLYSSPAWSSPEPRVFTEIQVVGNDRFKDQDVLVTAGIAPGEQLGEIELRSAVEALEFTGEFREVSITSQGSVLIITVREEPEYTGGLNFALGYDSDSGVLGVMGFVLRDVHGPDTEYRGDLSIAEEAQTLNLSYRAPNFWGDTRSGGVRFGYENYDYDNDLFDYQVATVSPYYNFKIGESVGAELRYSLSWDKIDNVDVGASNILITEAGSRVSSGVGISLITGSELLGRNGIGGSSWSLRFDQDFTGLGGDTNLSTTKLNFFGKMPIGGSGFAIRSRIELGKVSGRGSTNPVATDRFFLGGASLRGFERGTISPRDVCVGCAPGGGDQVTNLGGNSFAVARTDILIPIFPESSLIETFIFGDVGSSWDVETSAAPTGTLISDRQFRSSAGIGLSIATQIGTFESYLALGTNGERYDETSKFGLTFRSEF